MKVTKTAVATAAAAGGIAVATIFATPASAAPNIQGFGTSEQLIDGPLVTNYTVSNLQPSNVAIPGYTPKGTLYQADVTARSDGGLVTPMVNDFIARGPNGQNYRVIDKVGAPNGLNPAPTVRFPVFASSTPMMRSFWLGTSVGSGRASTFSKN